MRSRIAAPSRLVFKIPPDCGYIDLTFDALLNWRDWIPMLPGADRSGHIVAPSADRSIVQLPYGLALSPNDAARWAHSTQPVTHDGRTELWHTRLTSDNPRQPTTVTILQSDDPDGDMADVLTSLKATDREQLAGRTAEAHTLILSPMGGWLDVRGKWETESPIARWQNNVTAAQDQRVVVQYKDGFLYPFGHRASLITVTERKLGAPLESADTALLRQSTFVVIKEPETRYQHGEMAFKTLTTVDLVTPALHNRTPETGPFWIETGEDEPFLFRFRGRDWADRKIDLEAAAIFVTDENNLIAKANDLYAKSRSRRTCAMNGQAVAVARFESDEYPDTDQWGESLREIRNTGDKDPRTVGDTTLQLLKVRFAGGRRATGEDVPPFPCRTDAMEARVPSLDPYLKDDLNRGWFELTDPEAEGNKGEVFAVATDPKIPLYFDKQADRCGGLAAPSFDVAGLSRVRGPVGDIGPMREGGQLEPDKYFKADSANLLGNFPLTDLLRKSESGKSPAVPKFYSFVGCKQPDKYAEEGAKPYWEAGLGLKWEIPLHDASVGIFSFVADKDNKKQTISWLVLDASLSKVLGHCDSDKHSTDETKASIDAVSDSEEPNSSTEGGGDKDAGDLAFGWSVSGTITNFALATDVKGFGRLTIGFDHLGANLSPHRVKIKKGMEDEDEGGVEIDVKISSIKAERALGLFAALMQPLMKIPALMSALLPDDRISSTYPAKLPDTGNADLSVTLGPFQAPKMEFLKCEASNIAASVGVGLYFFPRPDEITGESKVPHTLLTFRLASPEEPLTLMAGQWGGICHVGFNVADGLTGFQAGIGLVRKFKINLGVSNAECKGSLSIVYTFVRKDHDPLQQLDLVLQLSGKAKIAGFVDITLQIVAAGSWQTNHDRWYVSASISVSIRISFFAVKISFAMSYRIAGEEDKEDKPKALQAAPNLGRLTGAAWHDYRAAFAHGV